jgi:hypothetical protein
VHWEKNRPRYNCHLFPLFSLLISLEPSSNHLRTS